jgi:serine acetyltransferase
VTGLLRAAVRPAHHAVLAVRRRRFLARLALSARSSAARIDVRVHPTARVGRAVRVVVDPGVGGVLHIGAHTTIDDGVEIRLQGGDLRIGDWVEVRRGAAFMVAGAIDIAGPNLVSWGAVVHCAERIELARWVVLSEHVTVTDSTHDHVDGEWHLDQVRTAPVAIGADTWVGAKSTITPGVTIGRGCTVGAGSVVTKDVPDGHVALGVPARNRPR